MIADGCDGCISADERVTGANQEGRRARGSKQALMQYANPIHFSRFSMGKKNNYSIINSNKYVLKKAILIAIVQIFLILFHQRKTIIFNLHISQRAASERKEEDSLKRK